VSARLADDGRAVAFSVADTGIGIAAEDRARIFEEFTQLDHPLQRRVRGTGLGLPLVRKLAGLLGGDVPLHSQLAARPPSPPTIPIVHAAAPSEAPGLAAPDERAESAHPAVLVVEDSAQDVLLYENYFRNSPFGLAIARTLAEARRLLERAPPVAVILDI